MASFCDEQPKILSEPDLRKGQLLRPAIYILFGNPTVFEGVALNAHPFECFVSRDIGTSDPIRHKGRIFSVVKDHIFKPNVALCAITLLEKAAT